MSHANYWENVPYTDLINDFFAAKPKDVDGVANSSALYYREYLLKKVFAILDWKNIPKTWDVDYMNEHLFLDGLFIITDTSAGILPLAAGLTGINVFNHPTRAIVANPVLGNFERVIDETCAVVKLQYNYCGIDNMLRRYSYLLASCDSAIAVNLMNSKVTFIGLAESKQQSDDMKLMYDKISCGEPAVFVKRDQIDSNSFFFNHVKENYVASDIQELKRSIVSEFLTEIGINNNNFEKKERLITDEVNSNNEEINCNVEHWLNNIKEGVAVANRLFDLNIDVSLKNFGDALTDENKGGVDDERNDKS